MGTWTNDTNLLDQVQQELKLEWFLPLHYLLLMIGHLIFDAPFPPNHAYMKK
jgi:hypothetical protein